MEKPNSVRPIVYGYKVYPGPTRVLDANGISIAVAVFAGLSKL